MNILKNLTKFVYDRDSNCDIPLLNFEKSWLSFPAISQRFMFHGFTMVSANNPNVPIRVGYVRCFQTDSEIFICDQPELFKDNELLYRYQVIKKRVSKECFGKFFGYLEQAVERNHPFFQIQKVGRWECSQFQDFILIPSFSTEKANEIIGYEKIWVHDKKVKRKFVGEKGVFSIGPRTENIFIAPDYESAWTIQNITKCFSVNAFSLENCLKVGEKTAASSLFQRVFICQAFSPNVENVILEHIKKKN